jgi:hypothetical protein
MSQAPLSPALAAPPKRRRRGRAFGILGGVVVVLLVVAAVVLDGVARAFAGSLIETKVRTSLSLPASTPVHVTVGGVSVLAQLAAGTLQRVDVAIDALPVGDLTGNATLTATGIPIDTSKPIGTVRLLFSADEAQVKKMLAAYGSVPVSSVSLANGAVNVGTTFSLLGTTLPIGIALAPSAVGGELALTPKTVTVNGATLTPTDLRGSFGSIADAVLATRTVCVAQYLPKALRLDAVSVKGASVELAIVGTSVLLDDSLLTTKGTCP